jgi:hypothetical protein
MLKSLDIAVIGAGPYGLSLAAHLNSRGVDFRIFGEPMASWKNNMPEGMLLKSYPWASNLSDATSDFTVEQFCSERGLPYKSTSAPLPVESFISYGEAFQERLVPNVERKSLISLEPTGSGFRALFDDGETVHARRVVLALGLSPFKYLPPIVSHLPPEVVSHSGDYGPLDGLDGKSVAVIGSGSSATDLCALLHERGVSVSLVARDDQLNFARPPRPRPMLERAVAPASGIGNGWTMAVCANTPWIVQMLPEDMRVQLANAKALGPLGGAFMRDRVMGKVSLWLGRSLDKADLRDGKVHLHLTGTDGASDVLQVDHAIFATGYKTDVGRIGFLKPELTAQMRLAVKAPQLSRHYESSIPGLHFIGPASANSFGPVCRFVFGTQHPARHLAHYLPAALASRAKAMIDQPSVDAAVLP